MGGTPPDLRQDARNALQHPRAADRRRARAGRLRGHRRDWHRGIEPWRVARRVRRARSPRAGADCGKPRRLRRDERLCYHPRQLRSRGGGSPAGVIRSRPAGPAVRPCARGRHRARIARAGGQRRADSRARAPAGAAGVERRAHAHTRRRLRRFRAGVLFMSTLAVYPGSFDPLTNGHVDIILRGARLFDRIIVAVAVNVEKSPLFTMAERVDIARSVFANQPNVEIDAFDGLLVDYVDQRGAQVIVRGLRALSDFELEFQMALMNHRLNPKIETVFMMPAEKYTYISSRLIKEVFSLGGQVHGLVPDMVEARLRGKRAPK